LLGRLLWGFLALAAAITIAQLSQGRTGYVLLALVCAAFFWVVVSKRFGLPLRVVLVGAVILLMISLVRYSPLMMQRFEQATSELQTADVDRQSSIGHRLYNYKRSIELIGKSPIVGTGTGSYHTVACTVLDKAERCDRYNWHPHNQFLLFGVDQGLIGLMLYIALLAAVVQYAARQSPEHRIAAYGLVMILAVDSMLNSALFSARENQFFLYTMALLMAQPLASEPRTQHA
jgi:O-antigen ligase